MHSLLQVIDSFKGAMIGSGIAPPDYVFADSALHRFHIEGDRKGSLNGAYVLHTAGDFAAGWYMSFKSGITSKWSFGQRNRITTKMRKQIEYAKSVREAEQAKAHAEAAQKALFLLENSTKITDPSQHPYLIRKRVKPLNSRLYREALVVPLIDESLLIINLQFIVANGEKRFLKGGKIKGSFAKIGDITEKILICEGWATAASLYEATGHCVIAAMSAGNLQPVAEIVRRQHPKAEIILCSDNDNVGIEKANKAAIACNGLVLTPPLAGDDFNDFINAGGIFQ